MRTWGRIISTIVVVVLALALLKYLVPKAPGFLGVSLFMSITLSFWGGYLGRPGKWIRGVAILVSIVLFFGSWGFTKHFAQSKKHDAETAMAGKSETVDPESETPKPGEVDTGVMVKFMRLPDGTLEKVPVTWKRNKFTGIPLSEPGTEAFWQELNEHAVQEARKSLKSDASSAMPPVTITLTRKNPVAAFSLAAGEWSSVYRYDPSEEPRAFDVEITDGNANVLVNGNDEYTVIGAVPRDPRLEDLRNIERGDDGIPGHNVVIVPRGVTILTYQIQGPAIGVVKTIW